MIDMLTLIRLCHGYRDMGNAITDQLDKFAEDPDLGAEDFNSNAVDVFMAWLEDVADLTHEFTLSDETRSLMEDIKMRTEFAAVT